MAGRLSGGIEGRRGQRYSTGALPYGASLALSEEVGTPMMAAPSRAAAAVTAIKAVFRFTAGLQSLDGMQGVCRQLHLAGKLSSIR